MTMEIDQLGGFLNSQHNLTIIGQIQTQGPNTLKFTQNISKYKTRRSRPASCPDGHRHYLAVGVSLTCKICLGHIYFIIHSYHNVTLYIRGFYRAGYCYKPGYISGWNVSQGQARTLSIKVRPAGRSCKSMKLFGIFSPDQRRNTGWAGYHYHRQSSHTGK